MFLMERKYSTSPLSSDSKHLDLIRVCTDIAKLWKVMENDNVIFQDLERFGKGMFFKMAMEKSWIFLCENSKISYSRYNCVSKC